MKDIRKRLRMLADNAQRSEIVEDAIRLIDSKDDGVGLIAAERQRQVAEEGWNSSHDDEHGNYELVSAACCYAKQAYLGDINPTAIKVPMGWPWDEKWWKPSSRIRMLVKAGALIAAEIDRALRQLGREAKEATPAGRWNMDLPIKVLSRNEVQIYGLLTKRSTLEEILRMMDEFEEESSSFISPSCLSKNHHICEQEGCTCGCYGEPTKWEPGMKAICYSSHHVNPVEFEIRKVVETPGFSHGPVLYAVDPFGSSHDSINCNPVPPPKEQPKPRFSGPHWDTANKYAAENIAAYKCICDIRNAWLDKEGEG